MQLKSLRLGAMALACALLVAAALPAPHSVAQTIVDPAISAEREAANRSDFHHAWKIRTEHFEIVTDYSLERGVELGVALEDFHRFFVREFAAFFNTPQQMQALFNAGAANTRDTGDRHASICDAPPSGFKTRRMGLPGKDYPLAADSPPPLSAASSASSAATRDLSPATAGSISASVKRGVMCCGQLTSQASTVSRMARSGLAS